MTYLEIVNRVLCRLRLSEANSVTSTSYTKLIGDFVNQAKREAEDAFHWLALKSSVDLTTSAGSATYILTGFGRRAVIERVHNTDTNAEIQAIDWYRFEQYLDFVTMNQNQPTWWRLNGIDTNSDDPIIEFLPVPDQAYAISVYATAPQADLAADSDVITLPAWPVILGAHVLAVTERGDDRGGEIGLLQREYQSALSDAIAKDNMNNHAGYSTDWRIP